MNRVKYLIIGNGIAGLSAVKEIRKKDNDGSITMISSEGINTYYRVKLTEYLAKDFEDESLLVSKNEWYKENDVDVILNKIVEGIDFDKNILKLDDSSEIEYEKLLIATGSRPFIPPITGRFKEGVMALRTLKDLRETQKYLETCEDVSVIGGGLLGLEAAWALKELGKKVSIVEFAPFLLPRQLDEEISAKLKKKLEDAGMILYLNSQAQEILGENRANGIQLSEDKKIKADAIMVSSGVRPNLDLVLNTKLDVDRGIKVSRGLKTNLDNVYAAGDVIERDGMVLGLWTAANEQGKIAGDNMTGGNSEYDNPKLFASLQIGDIKLFSAGINNDFSEVLEYQEGEDIHHKIFIKDGKVVGAILFGDTKDMVKVKNAVVNLVEKEEFLKDNEKFK